MANKAVSERATCLNTKVDIGVAVHAGSKRAACGLHWPPPLSEPMCASNGYAVTSGILVVVTNGSLLSTGPLETPVSLKLGFITRAG